MLSMTLSEFQNLGIELLEVRQRSVDFHEHLYRIFGEKTSSYLSRIIGSLFKAVPHLHDIIDYNFSRVEADQIYRTPKKPEKINLSQKIHSKLTISEYRSVFCVLDSIEDSFSSLKCYDVDLINWEKIDGYLMKLRYKLSSTAFKDVGIYF